MATEDSVTRYVILHPEHGVFLGVSSRGDLFWSMYGGIKGTDAPSVITEEEGERLIEIVETATTPPLAGMYMHPVKAAQERVTADELRAAGLDQYVGVLSHPAWGQEGGTA